MFVMILTAWIWCFPVAVYAAKSGMSTSSTFVAATVVERNEQPLRRMLTRLSTTNQQGIIDVVVAKKPELNKEKRLHFLPDGLKNSIASATATAVVKIVLQPLDTIKTIQQARPNIKLGPIKAAVEVIKQRGVAGLWSGVGISILGSSPSGAIYFGVYSSVKTHISKYFSPEYKLVAVALSAAIGNTFASVMRAPYEVLKQRIQTGRHASAWEAMVYSWRAEGPLGLFDKGKLTSQIFRDVPYAIVTLVTYEILQQTVVRALQRQLERQHQEAASVGKKRDNTKQAISARRNGNDMFTVVLSSLFGQGSNKRLKDALCGCVAGGFGSFVTTPMDVVKTRMMTSTQSDTVQKVVSRIAREEGLLTFFVGVGPRLMHKIPANGLFFLSYEAIRTFLGVADTGA